MRLHLERWNSPLGTLLLITDDAGTLRALDYADYEPRTQRLLLQHYGAYTLNEVPSPKSLTRSLEAYFAGNIDALDDLATETHGTPFQRRVWKALRAIPPARTITYGQLATNIDRPTASRAS